MVRMPDYVLGVVVTCSPWIRCVALEIIIEPSPKSTSFHVRARSSPSRAPVVTASTQKEYSQWSRVPSRKVCRCAGVQRLLRGA